MSTPENSNAFKMLSEAELMALPNDERLAWVVERLRGVPLFTEKLEDAKEYLSKVKMKPA